MNSVDVCSSYLARARKANFLGGDWVSLEADGPHPSLSSG